MSKYYKKGGILYNIFTQVVLYSTVILSILLYIT